METELPFNTFTLGIEAVTLGDLCRAGGGSIQTGPFGSQLHAKDYVEAGVPSIMPKNISVEGVSTQDIAYISEQDARRLNRYLVAEGDIVYSRRGDVEKCALITDREDGWLCGTGCLRVRLGSHSRITPEYLHAYLSHPAVTAWIAQRAVGATMPNLNTGILSSLPVFVPEIDKVRQVGTLWRSINKKIILNHNANAVLDTIAQTIFQSWFVRFDPVHAKNKAKNEGRDPERAAMIAISGKTETQLDHMPVDAYTSLASVVALFPDSMDEVQNRSIPEGWKLTDVGSITANIFSGGTPDTRKPEYWNGDLHWFSSGETRETVVTDTEKRITPLGAKNSSTRLAREGDILIASAGQGNTRGQTSYCAIETYINQSVIDVRADRSQCSPSWLFYELSGRYEEMRGISDSHSSRGSLTTKMVSGMSVLCPSVEVAKAFKEVVQPMLEKQKQNLLENAVLLRLRDYLLPKLISGELPISTEPMEAVNA